MRLGLHDDVQEDRADGFMRKEGSLGSGVSTKLTALELALAAFIVANRQGKQDLSGSNAEDLAASEPG